MKTYLIREPLPHGARLLAILNARNLEELFWLVDEDMDPTVCEYAVLKNAGGIHLDCALLPDEDGADFVSIQSLIDIRLSDEWGEDAAVVSWAPLPYPEINKRCEPDGV